MLSENDINGINLEYSVAWTMEHKFKIRVDHNRFDDSYPLDNHNIVDITSESSLTECTNPKETTWMNDEVMAKKLQYFIRRDPLHLLKWILIISFANFSDAIKQLIQQMRIELIELGFHADYKLDWRIVHALPKLAQILYGSKHKSLYKSTSINTHSNINSNNTPLLTNTHLHLHRDSNRIVLVSGRVDPEYDVYCSDNGYVLDWDIRRNS